MTIAIGTTCYIDWSAVGPNECLQALAGLSATGRRYSWVPTTSEHYRYDIAVGQAPPPGMAVPPGFSCVSMSRDEIGSVYALPDAALSEIGTSGLTEQATFEEAYGKITEIDTENDGRGVMQRDEDGQPKQLQIEYGEETVSVQFVGIPPALGTDITITIPGKTGTAWRVVRSRYREKPGVSKLGTIEIVALPQGGA
jgi:hypothetical protein